jgi:hypothetical protein
MIGYGTGNYMGQATPLAITVQPEATTQPAQATPTSTNTQSQWVTTHAFPANGPMKTADFTVANDWKMQWTCNPASDGLGQYNVIVAVYNADGTELDPMAFNTICKAGVTSGSTQEHQGGNVYLDNQTDGNVTITVQELQ